MDEREFNSFSRGLPSPEELFHADEWEEREPDRQEIEDLTQKEEKAVYIQAREEAEDVRERVQMEEPAPKRKKSKLFSAGFVIGLLALALVLTNLGFFHIRLFCMMSESMGDAIPKGSVIVSYEASAEKLQTGDVITYANRDGVLITHEIVNVISNYDGNGSYAFRTKGAANETEDEEAGKG